MASEYNLNGALLKLSISTEEAWANTTVIIPDGVVCYAVDRFQAKIGNGKDLYMDLPYAFDSIPTDLKTFIDEHTFIVTDENNTIPTGYFPKDVFNIHTAVGTIEDRNNLDIEVIRNSQLIFVADATDDPTVKAGFALYVAKFNSLWEYEWVKVGEQESIDLDFGEYLIASETTIDQLADTDTYKRLTQADLDVAVAALQASDDYTVDLMDHLYWYDTDSDSLIFHITGYNPNKYALNEISNPEYPVTITTHDAIVSGDSSIMRNRYTTLYVPKGLNYVLGRTTGTLQLLSKVSEWTVDFYFSLRETTYESVHSGIFGYFRTTANTNYNRFFLRRVSTDFIQFGVGLRVYTFPSIIPNRFHRVTIVHDLNSLDLHCYIGNNDSINNYAITIQNGANWYEDSSGSAIAIGSSLSNPNEIYATGTNWSEFKIHNKAIHPQYSSVTKLTI